MQSEKRPIRLRALVLGVLGGLLICAYTPYNNVYLGATLLGGGHFPLAPFFIAVWLMVLTAATARLTRTKPLFTGLEILLVWILMVLVSGIPYTGLVRTFFINLTAPFYFATVGNNWTEVLQPLLPASLYPGDATAIEQLYNGMPGAIHQPWWTVLGRISWAAWLPPLAWWTVFILLSYWVLTCMVNIFSRQWIENERINFPLLRLPQVMAEAMDEQWLLRFLTNPYLLAGIAVPVFIHGLNGLASYYPQVPQVPTLIQAGQYFSKFGLFQGFYKLRIWIYPAFIGFAFLTSRQISFSLWFFYLLGALMVGVFDVIGMRIPPVALGVTFGPTLAEVVETQMIGAYAIFFLFILWLARAHLAYVARVAFGMKPVGDPHTEWLSLRTAFWGLVIGFILLVGWCFYFGMPLLAAVVLLGAFLMVALVASRVICQGGIAYFTLSAAPTDGLLAMFGSKFFGGAGLLLAAVTQKVLFLDLRESIMPSLFHTAKVGEQASAKRRIFIAMVTVVLLGMLVSFAAMLVLGYKYGMRELKLDWATSTTLNVYDNVQRLIEAPQTSQDWVMGFSVVGAVVMLLLVICYHRFYWWPIHPIGYLATYSSAMRILWFSFLIGWLCNQLALRYGGITTFRKVRFFFFGLILGDFLMGGGWAVVGMITGVTYQALPD